MNNLSLMVLYGLLAGISLLLFVLSLRKKSQDRQDTNFRFVLSMLFCWQVVLVLYSGSTSRAVSLYLYDMDLPFVALSALAWFLYIVRFYGLDSYFPRVVVAALFVVPFFTLGVALTTPFHSFLRSSLQMLSTTPAHLVRSVRGPWFWYHAAYCYGLILVSFVLAVLQHRKIKKTYRHSSALLLLGLCITVAGNVLVLAAVVPFDISLVCLSLASLLLYIISRGRQGTEFFLRARQEVFHYIDHAILILDNDGGIVSMNRTAGMLLEQFGIPTGPPHVNGVTGPLQGRITRQSRLENEEQGYDCYLDSGQVYNIRQKPIWDNRQNPIGTFVIISDVKENRRVIDYLENATGRDALTGLANRRQFEAQARELDSAASLPLCAIVGDLNNLKSTNDRLGHAQGDVYIRLAAELLKETCPPSARVARTGGDEFCLLVPHFDEEQALALIFEISEAFRRLSGYPFEASISLGYAIKREERQSLAEVLELADMAMYQNKRHHSKRRTVPPT